MFSLAPNFFLEEIRFITNLSPFIYLPCTFIFMSKGPLCLNPNLQGHMATA